MKGCGLALSGSVLGSVAGPHEKAIYTYIQ